jgi:hypothetical protein
LRQGRTFGHDEKNQPGRQFVECRRRSSAANVQTRHDAFPASANDRYTWYNACRSTDWSLKQFIGSRCIDRPIWLMLLHIAFAKSADTRLLVLSA